MTDPTPGEDEGVPWPSRPYRPEDFTKLQYVPPTALQSAGTRLKILGIVTAATVFLATCAYMLSD